MTRSGKHLYEFGPFRLDASEGLLLRDGRPVPLTPKAFDTLVVLIENGGRLLGKDELIQKVWPDTFVEEGNLTNNIWALRKALGEEYIETVPRRGYRFIAPVREVHDDEDPAPTPFRWYAVAAAVLLVTLVASLLYFRLSGKSEEATDAGPIRSLAVLPFKSVGPQSADEYLGLGMADALITKLSNIRNLTVRPTRAITGYADRKEDPLSIGRELQVDAILDGTFQRSGERVRVTVQLIDARNGKPLWAEKFDERSADIFAVQDRVSENVAEALALRLSENEVAQMRRRYTDNAEAYQLYQRGRFHWNKRTAESLQKAIEYFDRATKIDPDYAPAYAALAESYVLLPWYGGIAPAEAFNKARAAATKALSIDDKLAEAHTALAYVAERYDWDWATAEREYRRALGLRRNYATARQWYAEYLVQVGRLDEAESEMKKALELDPLSLIINTEMATLLFHSRQYDLAIAQSLKALELDPNFVPAQITIGRCYVQKGMHAEAHAVFTKTLATDPEDPWLISHVGYNYGVWGKTKEARDILAQMLVLSRRKHVAAEFIATMYAGLGQNDQALDWLEKSCGLRETGMAWMKVHPAFDRVRSNPRFAGVLRCVGLPP